MLQVAFKIAIVATVCVIAQIVAKNSYIERSNRPYFCRDFFLGGGVRLRRIPKYKGGPPVHGLARHCPHLIIHGYKAEERWIESLNDTNESDAQDHFGMRQLFGESTVSVESSNLFGLPWTGRVKMVSVRAGHLSNREIQIITNFHYLKTLAVRGQLTEKEKGILQDFRKRRPKVEFVHLPY